MKKIIKLPISNWQRVKNGRGKNSVSCIISERWLEFSDNSTILNDGEYFFVSVMTLDKKENERKLCELAVSKEEMLR